MANNGTIVLVEDDADDIELIKVAICESFPLYHFRVFKTLTALFNWLNEPNEKPFIIICDNNWRNRNSEELKRLSGLNPHLIFTRIPFIFFTDDTRKEEINNAFEHLNIQGYFNKGTSYEETKASLVAVINYWERSCLPSND